MVKKVQKRGSDDLEFLDDNTLDEEFLEVEEFDTPKDDKTIPRAKMPPPIKPIETIKEVPPQVPPPVPQKPLPSKPLVTEEPQRINPREMVISSPMSDTLLSTISENLAGYKLIFFDGPNMGEEYSLDKNLITLGRGADNDIVIKDVSVSRRHAEISRDLNQIVIRDLGSGNGVILNDERITERELSSGDVIKLGNTKIRFVAVYDIYTTDTEQAWIGEKIVKQKVIEQPMDVQTTPQAKIPQPKPYVATKEQEKKKPILLYSAILFSLFVIVLVFIKFVVLSPDESGQVQDKKSEAVNAEKAMEAQKLLDEGIESYKKKDFKIAQEKFIAALSLDPNNRRAQQYKNRAEEELINKNYLDSAQEFMNKDSPKGAIEIVKKISPESVFYNDAQTILKAATVKYIAQLNEVVQRQMSEKNYQNALESVQEILSLDPTDVKAQELKTQIEKAIATPSKRSQEPSQKVAMAGKPKKEKEPVEEEDISQKAISAPGPIAGKAVQLFKDGDVNSAVQTIESSDAISNPKVQKLLQNLKAFAQLYPEGVSAYKSKKETAIPSLEKAYTIAKSIAPGKDNKYLPELSKMLSDMYTYKGIKDFYKEDYFSAIENLQKALKMNPENEAAKKKMAEMGNIAQRLFEEAYVLKNADPEAAKKKFKIILKIAPPDSEFYKKAKEWLSKL
ncbi:MAG: FHA domain-containing protein [Deltaproteobacteria bacterium]|nr:FHA domain-containing protein [Deltaproteobacteria bacterium]